MVEKKSGFGPRNSSELAAEWHSGRPNRLVQQPLVGLEGDMRTKSQYGVSTERTPRSVASPNGVTTPNGRHPGK